MKMKTGGQERSLDIKIARLPASRWIEYRDLRLESLKSDPTSFGPSYSEERGLKGKKWREWMKDMLFALYEDKPIGTIAYVFGKWKGTSHVANVYCVFVSKKYRGMGVGSQLLESALSAIRKNKKALVVDLSVTPGKKAAVRLYEKHGFKPVGRLSKTLKFNGRFYDEVMMEKLL